jgi:hypothetical protein
MCRSGRAEPASSRSFGRVIRCGPCKLTAGEVHAVPAARAGGGTVAGAPAIASTGRYDGHFDHPDNRRSRTLASGLLGRGTRTPAATPDQGIRRGPSIGPRPRRRDDRSVDRSRFLATVTDPPAPSRPSTGSTAATVAAGGRGRRGRPALGQRERSMAHGFTAQPLMCGDRGAGHRRLATLTRARRRAALRTSQT